MAIALRLRRIKSFSFVDSAGENPEPCLHHKTDKARWRFVACRDLNWRRRHTKRSLVLVLRFGRLSVVALQRTGLVGKLT